MSNVIALFGLLERSEFRQAYRDIRTLDCELLTGSLSEAESANLCIIFQSYPGEFSQAELCRFQKNHPFVPIILIPGTCCEGMLRTGHPIETPFYLYAHHWSNEFLQQIAHFLEGKPSLFSLPLTTENDEIAVWENKPANLAALLASRNADKPCLILSHFGPLGNDSAMNRFLAGYYERSGYRISFSGEPLPESFAGKIVADADDSPFDEILRSIQALRYLYVDIGLTVCLHAPRSDEIARLQDVGVGQIISKPFAAFYAEHS
jgi:hypothetical protein